MCGLKMCRNSTTNSITNLAVAAPQAPYYTSVIANARANMTRAHNNSLLPPIAPWRVPSRSLHGPTSDRYTGSTGPHFIAFTAFFVALAAFAASCSRFNELIILSLAISIGSVFGLVRDSGSRSRSVFGLVLGGHCSLNMFM
jgi:hypothetical protein